MAELNLDFYDGFSIYIYPELKKMDKSTIEILKNNNIKDDTFNNNFFLDYYSHLMRVDTISMFDYKKNAEVLEINACFGVITEFLCDRVKNVTAVEMAKTNAEIIYERLKDKDNLEIICGKLDKIEFKKKFDYIILTDILEFADFFFKGVNPPKKMIEYFKSLLKPNGLIIFQGFNRFGIKNWAGALDEFTFKPFDSLQNYPKFSLKSYSKNELENIFNSCEFEYIKFYYPVPSHYFAWGNLSDEYLENSTNIDNRIINFFENNYFLTSEENHLKYKLSHIIGDIIHVQKEYPFFSNSFLIFAGKKEPKHMPYFSKFARGIATSLVEDKEKNKKYVIKSPINEFGQKNIETQYNYYISETQRLKDLNIKNIKLVKCKKQGDNLIFDWAKGDSLDKILLKYIKKGDEKALLNIFKEIKEIYYLMYPDKVLMDYKSENVKHIFGNFQIPKVWCVKNVNYDLHITNLFKYRNKYTIIDYDHICPYYIPLNYIIFIGLASFNIKILYNQKFLDIFGIRQDELKTYIQMMLYTKKTNDKAFDIK